MAKQDPELPLNRREFLRMVISLGGATALAAVLEACSRAIEQGEVAAAPTSTQPMPTATQAPAASATPMPTQSQPSATNAPATTATTTPEEVMARVVLVKTNDRAEGVRRALALWGIEPLAGKRIFIKPNFNSADPAPGSTHPEVLRALVTSLQANGAGQITVGDRSGMGDTRRVMEQVGAFRLAEELGFEAMIFDELGAEDWVIIQPPGNHWARGFPMARACLEAEALVQTCCLKTHRYGGHFTMSLKNSVGLVAKRIPGDSYNYMTELHQSRHQRRMIAEINAAYAPALVVLDGVEAFISGGPDQGERVSPGVVLAGTDRVALDAVGVALLRYHGCKTEAGRGKIFEQEQIARAVNLGLGVESAEKIQFVTEDEVSAAYSEAIKEVLLAG